MKQFIFPLILVFLLSCNNISKSRRRFNKLQWDSTGDLYSHPNRAGMFEDLTNNHKIKGLTYQQLIDSIGQPDNYGSTKDSIYYDITTNYGSLDPKSGRYLAIGFNKDSVITGFKIVDWKNRHANE